MLSGEKESDPSLLLSDGCKPARKSVVKRHSGVFGIIALNPEYAFIKGLYPTFGDSNL